MTMTFVKDHTHSLSLSLVVAKVALKGQTSHDTKYKQIAQATTCTIIGLHGTGQDNADCWITILEFMMGRSQIRN